MLFRLGLDRGPLTEMAPMPCDETVAPRQLNRVALSRVAQGLFGSV